MIKLWIVLYYVLVSTVAVNGRGIVVSNPPQSVLEYKVFDTEEAVFEFAKKTSYFVSVYEVRIDSYQATERNWSPFGEVSGEWETIGFGEQTLLVSTETIKGDCKLAR